MVLPGRDVVKADGQRLEGGLIDYDDDGGGDDDDDFCSLVQINRGAVVAKAMSRVHMYCTVFLRPVLWRRDVTPNCTSVVQLSLI